MLSKLKVKYIQSLGQKKQRDAEGLFIAEGPKIVAELMRSTPQYIKEIYAVKEWLNDMGSHPVQIEFTEVNEEELKRLTQLKTPHGVLAIVRHFNVEEDITVKGKVSLVLDTIQDPGNLGTIIRIADWFGIGQIICSPECADLYNPKTVQSTMGSLARVKIFYRDIVRWLKDQKEISIYAATLNGKDVTKMSALKEGLIILGNESKGIHEEILQLANERITIPGKGHAESLNAGIAAGIILSHIIT